MFEFLNNSTLWTAKGPRMLGGAGTTSIAGGGTTSILCSIADADDEVCSVAAVPMLSGVALIVASLLVDNSESEEYLNSMSSEELTTIIQETYTREEELEKENGYQQLETNKGGISKEQQELESKIQQLESEIKELKEYLNSVDNQGLETTGYQKRLKQ